MSDFTDEFNERLLLKKVLTDVKYIKDLSNSFDIRWCDTKDVSVLIYLSLSYFKKYGERPNTSILQEMLSKSIEARIFDSDNRKSKLYHFYPELDYKTANGILVDVANQNVGLSDEAISTNVQEYVKKRALYYSISDNLEEMNRTGSVDKCLATFEKFQRLTFADDDIGTNYFSKEAQDKHWNELQNPESKISTGWEGLDKYTNDGFPKEGKFLGLILAQSGLGKSLFLSNLAVNFLKQNLTVGVISLEMSEQVYSQRFSAHISKNNVNRLRFVVEDSRKKIDEFYQKYPNANLYIKEYPPRSINSRDIDSYLEKLRDKGIKLDVLIVDYLNLVISNQKTDTMFEGGMLVSEELRSLSYKWAIPIISAVQSNSEGMGNSDIDMENVSQSRGIVFTADFISALYQTDDDRENAIINMRLVKNRLGGQIGKIIQFKMNYDNLTAEDISFTTQSTTLNSEANELLRNLPDISADINAI